MVARKVVKEIWNDDLRNDVSLVDLSRLDDIASECIASKVIRGAPGKGDTGVGDVTHPQRTQNMARLHHHTCQTYLSLNYLVYIPIQNGFNSITLYYWL